MNLTDPIRRHAHERPDAPAVILPNSRQITYRMLDRRIDVVASGICELGLAAGALVGIQSARPFRDLCCRLALARLGLVMAPRSIPAEALAVQLTDGASAEPSGARVAPIAHLFGAARESTDAALKGMPYADSASVCARFPTSGTTGTPRFVAVTHAVMAHRIAARSPSRQLSHVGAVSSDGLLTLIGRTTDVINAGGVKINPQPIEDVLLSLPGIEDAAAFGVPDALGVTRIWAAVVAGGNVDLEAARALCRDRLRSAAPASFLRVKALPRNEAGKVLREPLCQRAAAIVARRSAASP